jgi:chromosome segregation ATPase
VSDALDRVKELLKEHGLVAPAAETLERNARDTATSAEETSAHVTALVEGLRDVEKELFAEREEREQLEAELSLVRTQQTHDSEAETCAQQMFERLEEIRELDLIRSRRGPKLDLIPIEMCREVEGYLARHRDAGVPQIVKNTSNLVTDKLLRRYLRARDRLQIEGELVGVPRPNSKLRPSRVESPST